MKEPSKPQRTFEDSLRLIIKNALPETVIRYLIHGTLTEITVDSLQLTLLRLLVLLKSLKSSNNTN